MKNKIKSILIIFLIGSSQFFACKKDSLPPPLPNTKLGLNLATEVDKLPLLFDTLMYTTPSQSKFSVSRLEYYISNIRLYLSNGSFYSVPEIYYVNARDSFKTIWISNMPEATYTAIDFLIGIAPHANLSNSLDNSPENINMQWPDVIGGGYHFLKLEGRYIDTANQNVGYTMHLGTNEMLVQHKKINCLISIQAHKTSKIQVTMNVNEWFKNPYTYDFNLDGNYTMAIPKLMNLLKTNGYDTFTLE